MGMITWSEYKAMTGDNVHDQVTAENAIDAAGGVLTEYVGDRFSVAQRTQKEYFTQPRTTMILKAYPLTDADVTITGADAKYIDRESGIVLFKHPVCEREITVTYTAGMDGVPKELQQACALLTMHILTGVEQGGSEVSSETLGDYSTTYRATNGKLPDIVWMLIKKFVR